MEKLKQAIGIFDLDCQWKMEKWSHKNRISASGSLKINILPVCDKSDLVQINIKNR